MTMEYLLIINKAASCYTNVKARRNIRLLVSFFDYSANIVTKFKLS
jgi:hypothetical protein